MNKTVKISIGVIIALILAYVAYKYFTVPTLTLYQYDATKKTGKFRFGGKEGIIDPMGTTVVMAPIGWSIIPSLNTAGKLVFNVSQFGRPKSTLIPKGIKA